MEGAHQEKLHCSKGVTHSPQHGDLTTSPADPQRTLAHVVRITLLPTLQRRTTQSWKGRGTGVPDRYSTTTSQETPSVPRPHAPSGPGSWRVVDS